MRAWRAWGAIPAGLAMALLAWTPGDARAQEPAKTPSIPAAPAGVAYTSFRPSDPALQGLACEYAMLLPDGFEKTRACPVLLALPPGKGEKAMVEAGIRSYWKPLVERGWVVVSPTAPAGHALADDGHAILPALLDEVASRVLVEGGKVHLAGASNGGRAAFRAATLYPDRFASLTVLPGFPPAPEDAKRLGRLKGMNVRMFVGENDPAWRREGEACAKQLLDLGVEVSLSVVGNQGHVIEFPAGTLEGVLEELRAPFRGAPDSVPLNAIPREETAAIEAALAEFHAAVGAGEESRVVASLAPEAVILGLDPAQRWDRQGFVRWLIARDEKAIGKSRSLGTKAWTAAVRSRSITPGVSGEFAWFDEQLRHPEWGDLRGSGVAIRLQGGWFIAQYHLALAIPDESSGRILGALKDPGARVTPRH